jgi:hypothetical protein
MGPDAALSTPPAPITPNLTPAAAPAAAAASWYPEQFKGFMETKGNPDPAAFVESYVNLEKLVGADPKTVLRMPKEGDVDAWGQFYGKLGRPESADKYTPIEALKDDPLAKDFDGVFHGLGLSEKQRTGILTTLLEKTAALNKENDTKFVETETVNQKKRMEALTSEQGDAMAQFTEDARRAARTAVPDEYKDPATGKVWTKDEINRTIEQAVGVDLALRIFSTLGKFQAEDKSESGITPSSGVLSGEQAEMRWNQLRNDRTWFDRYMAGDVEARREKERLDIAMASKRAA